MPSQLNIEWEHKNDQIVNVKNREDSKSVEAEVETRMKQNVKAKKEKCQPKERQNKVKQNQHAKEQHTQQKTNSSTTKSYPLL